MKLDRFFATIAPFLEGRIGHAEAAQALYGPGPRSVDAERLAIYGRFCRIHRFRSVDGVFGHCRTVIVRHAGEDAWEALVEGYYREHPMRCFEMNANGAGLPAHLARALDGELGRSCPRYLAELADFEWWEWLTRTVPDPDPDPERDPEPEPASAAGALSIAPAVELRTYGHDFVTWIDDEEGPDQGAPAPRATHVVFWRDADGDPRRENATALELLCLKWVFEGCPGPLALLAAKLPGTSEAELRDTLDDLLQAGILAARSGL